MRFVLFQAIHLGQDFSYDLAELGRYYRCYSELMTHWRAVVPPDAILDVSYEDVVDDLEGQARRLIDYCGLPWDDRCLSFHKTSRTVKTASAVQVRQPLFRSSLQRWRKYEAGIGPLLQALGDIASRTPALSPAPFGLATPRTSQTRSALRQLSLRLRQQFGDLRLVPFVGLVGQGGLKLRFRAGLIVPLKQSHRQMISVYGRCGILLNHVQERICTALSGRFFFT